MFVEPGVTALDDGVRGLCGFAVISPEDENRDAAYFNSKGANTN